MSLPTTARRDSRGGAIALVLCGLIGIVVGVAAGLNIARLMVPPPTEARSVMQLLEAQQKTLSADAAAGRCLPLTPQRRELLSALIAMVPVSLRDTLVVDAAFERELKRLRVAALRLDAGSNPADCKARRAALSSMDNVCRDCHRAFRAGG